MCEKANKEAFIKDVFYNSGALLKEIYLIKGWSALMV